VHDLPTPDELRSLMANPRQQLPRRDEFRHRLPDNEILSWRSTVEAAARRGERIVTIEVARGRSKTEAQRGGSAASIFLGMGYKAIDSVYHRDPGGEDDWVWHNEVTVSW
jgi:hypothetical protein